MYPPLGGGYASRGEFISRRTPQRIFTAALRLPALHTSDVFAVSSDGDKAAHAPEAVSVVRCMHRRRAAAGEFACKRIAVTDREPVHMTTQRFAAAPLFAAALLAAGHAAAAPYTVAALAPDAQAVVLAAPDGQLQRLQRGDIVPSGHWRVERVDGTGAVFSRDLPGRAAPLTVSAKRGDTLDFTALDAHHAKPPQPTIVVDGRVQALPARPR